MSSQNNYVVEVKQSIEQLIQAGTSFDVSALERIYHDDLQVIMIDDQGEVTNADKAAFKNLFQSKRDNGEASLNTWAKFNRIDANESSGHVLITRKVKLIDKNQKLILSIDLVRNNGHWQVIREVIFAQPDED